MKIIIFSLGFSIAFIIYQLICIKFPKRYYEVTIHKEYINEDEIISVRIHQNKLKTIGKITSTHTFIPTKGNSLFAGRELKMINRNHNGIISTVYDFNGYEQLKQSEMRTFFYNLSNNI